MQLYTSVSIPLPVAQAAWRCNTPIPPGSKTLVLCRCLQMHIDADKEIQIKIRSYTHLYISADLLLEPLGAILSQFSQPTLKQDSSSMQIFIYGHRQICIDGHRYSQRDIDRQIDVAIGLGLTRQMYMATSIYLSIYFQLYLCPSIYIHRVNPPPTCCSSRFEQSSANSASHPSSRTRVSMGPRASPHRPPLNCFEDPTYTRKRS